MPEVYMVQLDPRIGRSLTDQVVRHLSAERQLRVEKFRNYMDARRSITAELLVRRLAMDQLGVRNEDIVFGENSYNKPYLVSSPHFHYNLSHSGEWVVCAVDQQPVGIDIEQIKPIELDIAKNFFTTAEYNRLMEADEAQRLEQFYQLWTLKESYIKAVGQGLSIPLDSFSFRHENGDDRFTLETPAPEPYHLTATRLPPNYVMAVCAMEEAAIDPVAVNEQELLEGFLRL